MAAWTIDLHDKNISSILNPTHLNDDRYFLQDRVVLELGAHRNHVRTGYRITATMCLPAYMIPIVIGYDLGELLL